MSRFEDQVIAAYVDGELDPAWTAQLEAAMAADPVLAARVARHAELRTAAGGAFANVLAEPVPDRLTRLLAPPRPARAPARFSLPQWAAMAACLMAGVMLGRVVTAPNPLAPTEDGLQARGALAQALDERLSADAGPIRIGLTFREREGAYCRTFQMTRESLAGVACKKADHWAVRVTIHAPSPASRDYRMAGAETPPAVLAHVDAVIAGAPLDMDQEIAARDAGWR